MKWNCPHCGTVLALGDDKMSGGWAFSRCYKCAGHALIRRAEISVIKVDRAPPGERVLMPEASDNPTQGLSQTATQQLASRMQALQAAPTPVAVQSHVQTQADASYARMLTQAQMQHHAQQAVIGAAQPAAGLGIPLPEIHTASRVRQPNSSRAMPIAMGIAATLAVSSGAYLLIQGRTLWEKATQVATVQRSQPPIVSVTTQAAPVTANTESAAGSVSAQIPMQAPANIPELKISAPEAAPSLMVRARSTSTKLHSGPGLAYPVVGTANPEARFKVMEWKDRWFRIAEPANEKSAGWVRNDQMDSIAE